MEDHLLGLIDMEDEKSNANVSIHMDDMNDAVNNQVTIAAPLIHQTSKMKKKSTASIHGPLTALIADKSRLHECMEAFSRNCDQEATLSTFFTKTCVHLVSHFKANKVSSLRVLFAGVSSSSTQKLIITKLQTKFSQIEVTVLEPNSLLLLGSRNNLEPLQTDSRSPPPKHGVARISIEFVRGTLANCVASKNEASLDLIVVINSLIHSDNMSMTLVKCLDLLAPQGRMIVIHPSSDSAFSKVWAKHRTQLPSKDSSLKSSEEMKNVLSSMRGVSFNSSELTSILRIPKSLENDPEARLLVDYIVQTAGFVKRAESRLKKDVLETIRSLSDCREEQTFCFSNSLSAFVIDRD